MLSGDPEKGLQEGEGQLMMGRMLQALQVCNVKGINFHAISLSSIMNEWKYMTCFSPPMMS